MPRNYLEFKMNKHIYLDYAAATPLDPEVLKAMLPYLTQDFYNPSATYLAGRQVRSELEKARATIAQLLGARPAEIIFTAGATEANNMAICGIARKFLKAKILVSSIEHESVLAPAKLFDHEQIPVDKKGIIDIARLERMITDDVVLVSVMLVNNELGTIQPIRQVAQLIEKVRTQRKKSAKSLPLYLHTDAAQAPNYLDLHTSRLGVDLMSVNGSKVYGPKQTGALYVKAGVELEPLITGGGQERGMRSGTENVAGFVGLAAALAKAQNLREEESLRVSGLRQLLIDELSPACPGALINGSTKNVAPHILSVTFPGYDNERLMMQLDEEGVMAAVGSACSASSDEPSHVLGALGLADKDARATLRLSFGRQTTKDDIKKTAYLLARICK